MKGLAISCIKAREKRGEIVIFFFFLLCMKMLLWFYETFLWTLAIFTLPLFWTAYPNQNIKNVTLLNLCRLVVLYVLSLGSMSYSWIETIGSGDTTWMRNTREGLVETVGPITKRTCDFARSNDESVALELVTSAVFSLLYVLRTMLALFVAVNRSLQELGILFPREIRFGCHLFLYNICIGMQMLPGTWNCKFILV